VLVLSASSSRARSKRVTNQIMFDVLNPLVVHVLYPGMGDFGVIEICSVIYGAYYAVRRHTP